jgi:hypothetical protein
MKYEREKEEKEEIGSVEDPDRFDTGPDLVFHRLYILTRIRIRLFDPEPYRF